MEAIQLIQISKEELMQDFEKMIQKALEKLNLSKESQTEKEFYTREETAKLLNVSFTTLFHWNNQGILQAKKRGKRVYYSKTDIQAHLNQ